MKTLKSILKKGLVVIMVMALVLTSFAGSAESVSAHRRGVTHSRKHVVRRRANGHAKKSHRARRVTRRRVVRRKAPRRRKVPVRRRKAVRHVKRRAPVRKKRPAPKKRRVVRKKRAAKKRQAPRRKKAAKKRKAAPKKKRAAKKRKATSKKKAATKQKVSKKKKATKKRQVSHAKKSAKKRQPATKKKKASGSALIATISRKTGISKSILSMVGDFVGYNDLYTMFTGKDAATGKPRSRWIGAAWTAFNFIPISKVEKIAKVAKILVTARKGEKVAKDVRVGHLATRAITKRTGETAAKKAAQKRAEQLVKQRKKVKPVKAKPKVKRTKTPGRRVMSKKAYNKKYGKKVTKKQKQFNKKKSAQKARQQSYSLNKGRTKKKKLESNKNSNKQNREKQSATPYRHNKVAFPTKPAIVQHIYKKSEGHFQVQTKVHDHAILNVVRTRSYFKKVDKFGNEWYAKTQKDGYQIWVRVRDGQITDAGINKREVPVMDDGMHKVSWYIERGLLR